jgi:hypothetical protein
MSFSPCVPTFTHYVLQQRSWLAGFALSESQNIFKFLSSSAQMRELICFWFRALMMIMEMVKLNIRHVRRILAASS